MAQLQMCVPAAAPGRSHPGAAPNVTCPVIGAVATVCYPAAQVSDSISNRTGGREVPLLSVIVPCFNEEAVIAETHRRLSASLNALGVTYEILFVDDGSRDATSEVLRGIQESDANVRMLRFSRNFGHQFATTAGLEHSSGRAVVLIDADLQDPPEVVGEMLAKWREGYEVVYGQRLSREGETHFKAWTAKLFYRLMNRVSDTPIPLDTGDFRLMDRRVVDALLAMPEHDRFLRGMVAWVGFRQVALPYRREARFAGTTKYPLRKMLRFATDGILSFSRAPLKLASMAGFFCAALALAGMLWAVLTRLMTHAWVAGWASIFLAVLFLGGVQLICLGIIGEYVGRIYGEAKHRPLYLVAERRGFERRE